MGFIVSKNRLRFLLNRFRERLWLKPLVVCLLSIAAVFGAKLADDTNLARWVPEIAPDSIETLLSLMGSSMLVIATFSVASMVSAYASASSTATPRSFSLVIADDVSQNALSTFVGAFIFSIVAVTTVKNSYFTTASLFILFSLTVIVFGVVIITFVRWVDRIARLGRLGSTTKMVEKATAEALKRLSNAPTLHGTALLSQAKEYAVFATSVGYVQYIDVAALQTWAEENQVSVVLIALPGTFVAPDQVLAYVNFCTNNEKTKIDYRPVIKSYQIGSNRLFDDDPRFGLVVLSEIAGRALSSSVNDPGTAIDIIGTLVRLFTQWNENTPDSENDMPKYDRVAVPKVSVSDMFNDAFTAIARDGAGTIEVAVRLQKALCCLASVGDSEMRAAAKYHGRQALERAQLAMNLPADLAAVLDAASFAIKND